MTTKHQPATPLPWLGGQTITARKDPSGAYDRISVAQRVNRPQDAAYIVHACEAYPKLAAFAQSIAAEGHRLGTHAARAEALLRELGEVS